ncbi:MAG: hypothetical protein Q6373_010390 [Candidatus Sigynarchaeota archaeon]
MDKQPGSDDKQAPRDVDIDASMKHLLELYEHFIADLQRHALNPIVPAIPK